MAEFAIRLTTKNWGRMIRPRLCRVEYQAGDAVEVRRNNFEWGNAVDFRQGGDWSGSCGILRVNGVNRAAGLRYTSYYLGGIPAFFGDREFYARDEEDRRYVRPRRVRYRLDLSAHPGLLTGNHFVQTNSPVWIQLI